MARDDATRLSKGKKANEPKIKRPACLAIDSLIIDPNEAETAAKDCADYLADLTEWANHPEARDPYEPVADPTSAVLWLLEAYNKAARLKAKGEPEAAYGDVLLLAETALSAAALATGNHFFAATIVPPARAGARLRWCDGHFVGRFGGLVADNSERLRQSLLTGRAMPRYDRLEARRLKRNIEQEMRVGPTTADPHACVYLGDGKIRIAGELVQLAHVEGCVVESLIDLGAANKASLVEQSGNGQAPRVLAQAIKRHPGLAPYIILPGKKGRGGYRTTIKRSK